MRVEVEEDGGGGEAHPRQYHPLGAQPVHEGAHGEGHGDADGSGDEHDQPPLVGGEAHDLIRVDDPEGGGHRYEEGRHHLDQHDYLQGAAHPLHGLQYAHVGTLQHLGDVPQAPTLPRLLLAYGLPQVP